MGADGAQADHELTGDLGTGRLGPEQAQHVQLTLAERLDQGLWMWSRGSGARRYTCARLSCRFKDGQKPAGVVWQDPVPGSFTKQFRHGWAFIDESADVAFRLCQRQC